MSDYKIHWNNACNTLRNIIKLEDRSPVKLDVERSLEYTKERIQDMIKDRRHINSDERFQFAEELSHVRLKQQHLESDYNSLLKFVNSPYFAKITTDSNDNYFISSHNYHLQEDISLQS